MLDRHTQLLLPLRSPLFPSVQVSECLEKSCSHRSDGISVHVNLDVVP